VNKTEAENSQTAKAEISCTIWKIPPSFGVLKQRA